MSIYQNQQRQVAEKKVTVLWNQKVKTDRTTRKNKAGIVIRDNEK
jgi:hypothetical protein